MGRAGGQEKREKIQKQNGVRYVGRGGSKGGGVPGGKTRHARSRARMGRILILNSYAHPPFRNPVSTPGRPGFRGWRKIEQILGPTQLLERYSNRDNYRVWNLDVFSIEGSLHNPSTHFAVQTDQYPSLSMHSIKL